MKKILILASGLATGGTEKHIFDLIKYSDKNEIKFVVWNFGSPGVYSEKIRKLGIEVIEKPLVSAKWLFAGALRFIIYLHKKRPDLVHSFLYGKHFIDALIVSMLGIPYIDSRRNIQHWRKGCSMNLREKWRNRVTRLFIANSEAAKKAAQEIEGIPAKKIKVIYNGIATLGMPRITTEEDCCFRIGNLANLKPIKDQETILKALRILVFEKNIKDIRLSFTVSEGADTDYYNFLRQKIAQLKLGSYVVFKEKYHPNEFLVDLDVMVLSSIAEGFSNAILESMMLGVPVVASNVGGNPEIVKDGATGFLYPVQDAFALSNILHSLYSNRTILRQLSENARVHVSQNFSIEKMIENYQGVYSAIMVQEV